MTRRAAKRVLLWSAALASLGSALGASGASAASCSFTGPGADWHTATNWSCNEVPDGGDSVSIGTADNVSVAAAASASSLVQTGGQITFSGNPTLAVAGNASMGADGDQVIVQGNGTMTVAGTFTKTGDGTMFVRNNGALQSADLVLNGAATLEEGAMCIARNDGSDPDQPHLEINDTFTITAAASSTPFNCSSSAPHIRIAATGHLIKQGTGDKTSFTVIDNDGTVTVEGGQLTLLAGTGGATSDGDYVATAGATLQFGGCCAEQYLVGATGRVGGAGTVDMSANPMILAAGATLDPALLNLEFGVLVLNGSTPLTLPVVNITNSAAFDTDRPVTATTLNTTGAATIRGTGSVTVPAAGSFTKTGSGSLSVTANLFEAAADLILNVDATLAGGSICVARSDDSDPDQPNLQINQDFTIGAGADALWYTCSTNARVHVNGPSGTLSKAGAGIASSNGGIEIAGGSVTVASGQTFSFVNAYAQSGGTTTVEGGGVLDANVALTGGTLGGSGEVDGNVTNTSGTVAPGTSPGTLTFDGAYSQGAGGTLEIEVAGTAQGTGYDHLSVAGPASLAGTVAIVQGAGFDPAFTDTFQFLTSSSRSGSFASLSGNVLPNGKTYDFAYPGPPDFGAGLVVEPPTAPAEGPFWERAWGRDALSGGGSGFEVCLAAVDCKQGAVGGGGGEVSGPQGVAVDSAGNVYVADTANHRIQKFDPSGAFLGAWGSNVNSVAPASGSCTVASQCQAASPGGLGGHFNAPQGVAVDASGNIYVADTGNQRIQKLDSSGAFVRAWGHDINSVAATNTCTAASQCQQGSPGTQGGEFTAPQGIAVDLSANVYVADTGNHRIQKFNSSGGFIRAWGEDVNTVVSSGACAAINQCQEGQPGGGGSAFNAPEGIAADQFGNLYVADTANHRIQKSSSTGVFLRAWGKDVNTVSSAVASCTAASQCQEGQPGGNGSQFSSPQGIAVDPLGSVHVADTGNQRIQRTTTSGAFRRAFGKGVNDGAGSANICTAVLDCEVGTTGALGGEFNSPQAIAANATGTAYVADTLNERVQRFIASQVTPPPQPGSPTPVPTPIPTLPLPTNHFNLGRLILNRTRGTATLVVSLPGPGSVRVSGPGLVPVRRPGAPSLHARPVAAAGKVELPIRPKGKVKKRLNETGRAKVKAKVTFTPTGGTANTETKTVKLVRDIAQKRPQPTDPAGAPA